MQQCNQWICECNIFNLSSDYCVSQSYLTLTVTPNKPPTNTINSDISKAWFIASRIAHYK